jgi:hypothetical protein
VLKHTRALSLRTARGQLKLEKVHNLQHVLYKYAKGCGLQANFVARSSR